MMEGVNGCVLVPPRKPLPKEVDDNGPSSKVDYHLNNLLASHLLSNPDLTPQEIAEASRSTAAAAATAAKAARATADEKAATAAKAVAAAKTALDLIASFPNHSCLGSDKHVSDSNLQLGDVTQGGIMSNSCSGCEDKNEPIDSREHAISKKLDFNGLVMELDSGRPNESAAGGEGAKEGIQVTRKRGRPKSK